MSDPSLIALALDWHRAGRGVALAFVVETWGSAPRPAGSMLLIDRDGAMEGSVSGGCVEGAVVVEAMAAIADGTPRLLDYGVSDDEAFAVGLACGGQIRVLIDPVGGALSETVLGEMVTAEQAKDPIAYVADLESSARHTVAASAYPARFQADRSGVEEDGRTFVVVQNPPLRMIIVGAVHIAQFLVPMARACGYQPILVDPRGAFGSVARFPGEEIHEDWPDEVLTKLCPDARTAVVTLTHDPKLDDPAIMATLRGPAFYLGCLGSTRTHAKRVARLRAAGFSDDEIGKINAPIGLNIGGKAPPEIAVSIMSEVTATLRSR